MRRNFYHSLYSSKLRLLVIALSLLIGKVAAQTTYTFVYTGSVQTITLPAGGYSIACWGANGGSLSANTATPGMGGYSSGNIVLTAPTTFSIYVGGVGSGGAQPLGGFNSGNSTTKTNITTATGGGGASDVRVLADSYYNRIIVAGGGGGQGTSTGFGGHGGGLSGQNGQGTTNAGVGGSQTAPGLYPAGGDSKPATFGEGGDGPAGTTGGQGGGGWYGGSFGTRTNGGGAGGSGYVLTASSFTPTGYFAANVNYYFTNTVSAQPATTGFVANPDPSGNGRVLITELCQLTLAASGTNSLNPIICSGQSLTLTTNAVSNYSWSTGATSSSLVVAPTTNTVYSLSATTAASCTTVRTISVTVSSGLPSMSISNPSTTVCFGQAVTLSASGALSYTWTNAGVVNGQSFTPAATAVYTVTGENGCGTSVATTTISVAPLAVSAAASSTLVCEGYTSTLTASSAVSNYTWMPGSFTGSMVVVAPNANTIYTVSASDGTCAGTQTVLITTKTTPVITASSTETMICQGETVTLTASGAGSGGTYSWTPGGAGSTISDMPASSTLYAVEGTNTLGCSSQAQQIVVVQLPPNMSVSAVQNKTTICLGQSATLTASGATGYSWVNGPATAGNVVSPSAAVTVYTVIGTHLTNTCVATGTINVVVITPSVAFTPTVNVCLGQAAVLTASGASSYTWNGFPSPGGSYTTTPATNSTISLISLSTLNNVSCSKTSTVLINVNPLPTLSITPTRKDICRKETNTLTVSGASSYTWSPGTSTGSVLVVSPTVSINYTVNAEDANGCENTITYFAIVKTCTGIEENYQEKVLSVFPNPSSGSITIFTEVDLKAELFNNLGEHIQSILLDAGNQHRVVLDNLPTGIYYLKGEDGGMTFSQKILIAK